MKKIPKQAYTAEFKELAVKRVVDGQAIVTVAKELGINDQTLRNWVKAAAAGKLSITTIDFSECELQRYALMPGCGVS